VLTYFNAVGTDSGIRFDWQTAKEIGNVGFNLYVVTEDGWVQVNERLIPSHNPDSFGPQDYSYEAAGLVGNTFYLEDIALWGERQLHGPFTLGDVSGERVQPEQIDWAAINAEHESLAAERTAIANQDAAAQSQAARAAQAQSSPLVRFAEWLRGPKQPKEASAQLSVAYPTLEFKVNTSGVYRVTYQDILQATGVDYNGVAGNQLALTNRGRAIPIYVSATTFGPGAYIEFYGQGLDTIYTDTNVYRLEVNSANALRIPVASAGVPRRAVFPASYMETVTVEENLNYSYWSPLADPWYGAYMIPNGQNDPQTYSFELDVDNFVGGQTTAAIDLWGFPSDNNSDRNHVQVLINGNQVADSVFVPGVAQTITAQIPNGGVANGNNTISVRVMGDRAEYEQVALESYSLTYPRAFVATDNQLDFTAMADAFKVTGLNSSQVVAYRLAGNSPTRLQGLKIESSGGAYQASFAGNNKGSMTYWVATEGALLKPGIGVALSSTDITSGSADLLIIAHPSFVSGFGPLVSAREAQGYNVKLVDVTQVYAQYSGGVFDAQAIRDYIRHAILNMGVKYIILGGGDTLNYRGYLAEEEHARYSISFIPSVYGKGIEGLQYVPLDPMYTDVNGDGVPDAALGRFPVRTVAELQAMVAKTLAYDANTNAGTAVLAAGRGFQGDSESFSIGLRSDVWSITKVYGSEIPNNDTAKATLKNALNTGPRLASFVGHSNEYLWGLSNVTPGFFSYLDARSLTNSTPMVITQWGCFNSYYVDPYYETLAHEFLLNGNSGAAVVAGATSLTMSRSERELGRLMMPYLAQPGQTVGSAMLKAKTELATRHPEMTDVILGWTLLGDPTVKVMP
jgi:hypothetical protein